VGNDCEAYWCDEPPPPCPYDELYVPP
jgi:hypothetical protein